MTHVAQAENLAVVATARDSSKANLADQTAYTQRFRYANHSDFCHSNNSRYMNGTHHTNIAHCSAIARAVMLSIPIAKPSIAPLAAPRRLLRSGARMPGKIGRAHV